MWSRVIVSDPQLPGVYVPDLIVSAEAWAMMSAYVAGVGNAEINGFGYVTRGVDGNFYWKKSTDVLITRQTVTLGTADVAKSDFARAVHQSMVDQREDDLHLQWHSHVWGQAYHSSKDMATIASYGAAAMSWFISLVTNKHGNATARLDQFYPFRIGAAMRIVVVNDIDQAMQDRAATEIEQLVTVKKPKKVTTIAIPGTDTTIVAKS